MTAILELRGITKSFPGVLANDHIDLKLENGEILALLGENGAGKTTLMNILYGLYQPDEGEVLINGEKATINSPIDAISHGVGMVHQHLRCGHDDGARTGFEPMVVRLYRSSMGLRAAGMRAAFQRLCQQ